MKSSKRTELSYRFVKDDVGNELRFRSLFGSELGAGLKYYIFVSI